MIKSAGNAINTAEIIMHLISIPIKHAQRGAEEIIVNPCYIQYIGPFGDEDYAVYFSSGDIQHIYISRETFNNLKKSLMK